MQTIFIEHKLIVMVAKGIASALSILTSNGFQHWSDSCIIEVLIEEYFTGIGNEEFEESSDNDHNGM